MAGAVNGPARWLVLAMLAGAMPGCLDRGDGAARDLLRAAVEAHGGVEALRRLDGLAMTCSGTFKGHATFTRRLDARLPDRWAMEVSLADGAVMRFGVDRGRCRRQDRLFVRTCDPAEYASTARVLEARLLHRLLDAPLRSAGTVEVGGRPCPAVQAGDLQLVFDPDSSVLRQVRYEKDRVETYSELREVAGGARFAARRVLTIGGAVDVDEVCEVLPGGADERRLVLPPENRDGDVVDGVDPERLVAVTVVRDPRAGDLRVVLDAAERELGPRLSRSDGWVLGPPSGPGGDWEVAVTLEPGARPPEAPGFRVETWPSRRYAGVFVAGDPLEAPSRWPRLSAVLDGRGLSAAPGARLEVLVPPAGGTPSLLRVAVVPSGTGEVDGPGPR